ncbi:MAG: hypothetical protein M1358_21495 [Chloroflexi bacterium]|nr:hypothetical protein [Chloroflexota bacterium]
MEIPSEGEHAVIEWEYLTMPFHADPGPKEMARMNALGAQGWELAGLTVGGGSTHSAVFKRRKVSKVAERTTEGDLEWIG